MAGMLETDSLVHDPIALFLTKLDHKIPDGRRLRDAISQPVIDAAVKWEREFRPLALKESRANEAEREQEKHEAVIAESHVRAGELSYYIRAVTARHPDLDDDLKPRIGSTPDEYIDNLVDMRKRINDHGAELTQRKITIKLDPTHTDAAIQEQVKAHRAAQVQIDRLETVIGSQQGSLVKLRKEGSKLQTRINRQISAAIEDDRPTQLLFGYTERVVARPLTAKEKEAKEKGAQEKAAKEARAKLATPPGPGPVASGQGAEKAGTAAEASAKAADAGASTTPVPAPTTPRA